MFKKIHNPFLFQGNLNKTKYFEGWYYKLVSKDQLYTLALIPGISLNSVNPHAFIQVFFTKKTSQNKLIKTSYIIFPKDDFHFEKDSLELSIHNNVFSKNNLSVKLSSEELIVEGSLKLLNLRPIETTVFSPSIMGLFSYFSFMECYHGIISMSHLLEGTLTVNNEMIDFTGGKGYIEKDWGKSFPEAYVWMQSNHFEDDSVSFMFSHAIIPFLGLKFKGLIINLVISGKEYRFATYNFARIKKCLIEDRHVYYELRKGRLKLMVEAWNDETTFLKSPKDGLMSQTIKEGLSGKIQIHLYHKNELIYTGTGFNSGLEIMFES